MELLEAREVYKAGDGGLSLGRGHVEIELLHQDLKAFDQPLDLIPSTRGFP